MNISEITKVTIISILTSQLIFERSQTGRVGYRLPPLDVDETDLKIVPNQFLS